MYNIQADRCTVISHSQPVKLDDSSHGPLSLSIILESGCSSMIVYHRPSRSSTTPNNIPHNLAISYNVMQNVSLGLKEWMAGSMFVPARFKSKLPVLRL